MRDLCKRCAEIDRDRTKDWDAPDMELMHVLSADTWDTTKLSLRCLNCSSVWQYSAVIHKSRYMWERTSPPQCRRNEHALSGLPGGLGERFSTAR
jgi:hypothetical protein